MQLLPSSSTKKSVWENYSVATKSIGQRIVGFSAFCKYWKKYIPHVIITKPMSDLCWVCQKNSSAIIRSANQPEEQKTKVSYQQLHYVQIITIKIQVYQQARAHIERASTEHAFYREACKEGRDTLQAAYTIVDGVFCPPLVASPCSLNLSTCVHYSFDYAQQVHYPSNPLQPGPIFFFNT